MISLIGFGKSGRVLVMFAQALAVAVLASAQVIGEPPGKIPVEVIHFGDDSGGEQLAFLLRDQFRASASFRSTSEDPSYRVFITSMDSSRITVGSSTTYAIVLTAVQAGSQFGYPEGYLNSAVYSCPLRQLTTCAREAYIAAATELELANKEYRDAANADIERMVRELRPQ